MSIVRVSGVEDFAALGERWRALERRSAGSFFQSWTWVGCLATERFDDAVLVAVTEAGRTVALALFNRVRRRIGPVVLYLGESGAAELDCPYVEQNGVLTEAGRENELTALCLREVASHDLVLSGLAESQVIAVRRAAGLVEVGRSQPSLFVDLAGLRRRSADYLDGRSANTRQQIRRSDRFYLQQGELVLEQAGCVPTAQAMLGEMAALHQAAWQARGQPGCFARPFFYRFHLALIEVAFPRSEAALLKLTAGGSVVGILYNFIYRGRMLAYQSGFAYSRDAVQAKPGLSCHHRAIRHALDKGMDVYDFLAGEDRYKRSLSDGSHQQVWVRAGPLWSPRMLVRAGLRCLR